LVFGDPAGLAHLRHAVGDHEGHIADDAAGQCHLQHQQQHRELVPGKAGEYRSKVHAGSMAYCALSWMADAMRQARHAGSSPASTLARMASRKVPRSMGTSMLASCA